MTTTMQQVMEDLNLFSAAEKMRRRPVHGKLFVHPSEKKRPSLQDMTITGKQMTLPHLFPTMEDGNVSDSEGLDLKKSITDVDALQKKVLPKRSPESTASRRQNRKAYSTPLSNAENRCKQMGQNRRPQDPELMQHPPVYTHSWVESPVREETEEGKGDRLDIFKETVKPDLENETLPTLLDMAQSLSPEAEDSDTVDTVPADSPSPDEFHVTEMRPSPSTQKPANQNKASVQVKRSPMRGKAAKLPNKSRTLKIGKSLQPTSKPTSKHKKGTLKFNQKAAPKFARPEKPPFSQKTIPDEECPQPLPFSLPAASTDPLPPSPPQSAELSASPTEQIQQTESKSKGRTPIKKRERIVTGQPCQKKEVVDDLPKPPVFVNKPSMLGYETEDVDKKTLEVKVQINQPTLPPVVPDLQATRSHSTISRIQRKLQAFHQPISNQKRWGPKKRDTSYEDELKKQEIAEARRKRQQEMLERMKENRFHQEMKEDGFNELPSFEDYGFLAKYCILSGTNLEMYKHTFQAVDDCRRGWLSGSDAMLALRATNSQLTETEEQYLYRILELTGYNISQGADFKLFSVLAALSQRITALDKWMKNLIGRMDFMMLDMKMFMCKNLWECNVDRDTNKISIKQLMIDLRAGGVSYQHECEVQEKLGHLVALDLLDFLTYIPLFIMIHESVLDNPLDDTREK